MKPDQFSWPSIDHLPTAPMTKRVSVVIVDLDNTLFDWVDIWHRSFKAMLDELVATSGIEREILIRDFKAVFTEHGTSEYAFALAELACLKQKHLGENIVAIYDSAIHAFRSARKDALNLYPTVEETLQQIKDAGTLVIGYTESMAYYTHFRLRRLGLDRVLDYIYSPADHDLPKGTTPEQFRSLPASEYELRRTIVRHTPKGEFKPNPHILLQIIRDVGATPDEAVYVGDSLMKDIAMAKDARVLDAWAKYGAAQSRPEYELLRQITHWPKATVEKEKVLSEAEIAPTITLKESFSELSQHVHFDAFIDRSPDKAKMAVDAWKMTVDVQKHFNELEMKVRNFALTVITAVLAGAAFSIKERVSLNISGLLVPLSSLILLVGAAVWVAFYLMDRFWYHQLLIGSVTHGIFIERRYQSFLPELALAEAIGKASPTPLFRWEIRSSRKLDLFYLFGVLLLLVAAIASLFVPAKDKSNSASPPGVSNSAVAAQSGDAKSTDQQNANASATPVNVAIPSHTSPALPLPDPTLPVPTSPPAMASPPLPTDPTKAASDNEGKSKTAEPPSPATAIPDTAAKLDDKRGDSAKPQPSRSSGSTAVPKEKSQK